MDVENNQSRHYESRDAVLQPYEKVEIDQLRLHLVMVVFAACFILVLFKLFEVVLFYDGKQVGRAALGSTEGHNRQRGEILDRNGVLLAVDLTTASLYANPKIILDPREAAAKLHYILPDLNYQQLLEELLSGKNFTWIKRNLTPTEQYAVNNLGIPGLYFEKAQKRVYTHGGLLSHVLGFVGVDGKGLAGIEKSFDAQLSKNQAVSLSIDSRVQNILSEELQAAIEEFRAIGAMGVVLNAKNGEVLASVSLPSFDPHNPGAANNEQIFNRFSLGLYEPGSIFKTFTMAMALDTGTISLNDSYNVDSPIHAARFNIGDYHGKGGSLTVPEIFMHSSNIGTAKISIDLGKKAQQSFLKKFGMLDALDIEIPEKSTPLYPQEKKWSDISMMTISYGHGIAVTPLHVVRAAAATLNGGMLHKLSFIKQDNNTENKSVRVLKSSTSSQMQKLFRLVVECGTGKKANVMGYLVGGKTGTADKNAKGVYRKDSRLSSFLAAFPINDPEYVVLVMLDEPKGTVNTGGYATAGMTAAPVSGKIIARTGALLGIELIDENSEAVRQALHLHVNDNVDEEL